MAIYLSILKDSLGHQMGFAHPFQIVIWLYNIHLKHACINGILAGLTFEYQSRDILRFILLRFGLGIVNLGLGLLNFEKATLESKSAY